jgi:DNA-binding transcriptional ArsR family regulator
MVKYYTIDLDAVFAALADPTRRAILEKLSHGPASVSELAEPFSISLPAVSKHLTVLSEAGLINTVKDGRVHMMHLQSGPLRRAAAWLDRYEKFWNVRIKALERLLTQPKPPKD